MFKVIYCPFYERNLIFSEYHANALIAKIHGISVLAMRASWKYVLDDAFAAKRSYLVLNTIRCAFGLASCCHHASGLR